MKSRKREILVLLIVVSVCAVLFADRGIKPGVSYDPNQLVIETRYSQRKAEEIWLRRGGQQLVKLPRTFAWLSGGRMQEVLPVLGEPGFTAEFMGDTLYIWECPVRYDWDISLEQPGRYLALGMGYNGHISSASSYPELPVNASPISKAELERLIQAREPEEDW